MLDFTNVDTSDMSDRRLADLDAIRSGKKTVTLVGYTRATVPARFYVFEMEGATVLHCLYVYANGRKEFDRIGPRSIVEENIAEEPENWVILNTPGLIVYNGDAAAYIAACETKFMAESRGADPNRALAEAEIKEYFAFDRLNRGCDFPSQAELDFLYENYMREENEKFGTAVRR